VDHHLRSSSFTITATQKKQSDAVTEKILTVAGLELNFHVVEKEPQDLKTDLDPVDLVRPRDVQNFVLRLVDCHHPVAGRI